MPMSKSGLSASAGSSSGARRDSEKFHFSASPANSVASGGSFKGFP
jgi:hypothetical protein